MRGLAASPQARAPLAAATLGLCLALAACGGGTGSGGGGAAAGPPDCETFRPAVRRCAADVRPVARDCGDAGYCCPLDRPFTCPGPQTCHATAAEAIAACGECRPCRFSGGAGNDGAGSVARFDGTYAGRFRYGDWPFVEVLPATASVTSASGVLEARIGGSPDAVLLIGGAMTGAGSVRADGYASWTVAGTARDVALSWECGATFLRSGGAYTIEGACLGQCVQVGQPLRRCTAYFVLAGQ